eukprot:362279-Chlamydomonas_euryale.AAC.3
MRCADGLCGVWNGVDACGWGRGWGGRARQGALMVCEGWFVLKWGGGYEEGQDVVRHVWREG